ncbi:MAG: L,D-transpeptidase [Roseibacillus sp.]
MKSLHVSVPDQEVRLYDDGDLLLSLPASTSKFGLGSEEGSNRTPLGKFRICEKYGAKAPEGTVFKGRKPHGVWTPEQETPDDLVLSRIFRLESKESGIENTYLRYIYFHGTNQEALIGAPASHGCIRLKNSDITALFHQVPVGTPVHIFNTSFS